jgi:hypothetical protein
VTRFPLLEQLRERSEVADLAPLRREIGEAWRTLEESGFPPEACGYPFRDIAGLLPEAIDCALDCLIRQRNDLLAEVLELRKLKARKSSRVRVPRSKPKARAR